MKQARNRKVHYQSFNNLLDDLLKDPEYSAHLAPTFGTTRTVNYTENELSRSFNRQNPRSQPES